MSCFILSNKSIASIAAYIERISNMDYEVNGVSLPESLRAVVGSGFINAKDVFAMLYDMNQTAYCSRYKDEQPEPIPDYIPYDISKTVKYDNEHFIVEPWHYQLLKSIQCLIYQCEERATENSDLMAGLKDLCAVLKGFIVCNNDFYAAAVWG